MIPPISQSLAENSRETGISEPSLYTWKQIISERKSRTCRSIKSKGENLYEISLSRFHTIKLHHPAIHAAFIDYYLQSNKTKICLKLLL